MSPSLARSTLMPDNRALTWLFLAASVVIDLVLLATVSADPSERLPAALLQGLALGQVGVLAIWMVTGTMHRLARAACLVVSAGLLTLFMAENQTWFLDDLLTLLACYAVVLVGLVEVITMARHGNAGKWGEVSSWRISLVELFGWTIVVAIASFGVRFMDFEAVANSLAFPFTWLALLAVPVIAELISRHRLKAMHTLTWLVFVCGACSVGHYLRSLSDGPSVLAAQATYLAAWMIVRSLEHSELPLEEVVPTNHDILPMVSEPGPTS